MEQKGRTDWRATGREGKSQTEPLHGEKKLYVGIDIGSISSDVIVLDESGVVVFSDYQRTLGKPIETASRQLREVLKQINLSDIVFAAATGSVGGFLPRRWTFLL